MTLNHSTIRLTDGHRVGVTTSPGEQPLVFLHGFSVNRRLYDPMLEYLAGAGYAITAIDLAGHGDTDPLPFGHSFDDVVDLVRRTLAEIGSGPAILVGHSFGGRIAAEIASQDSSVRELILMGAAAGQPFDDYEGQHLLIKLASVPLRLVAVAADNLLGAPKCPVASLLYLARMTSVVVDSWSGLARVGWAASFGVDTVSALDKVRRRDIPTAVIHGERDLVVPLECAESTAEVAGGSLEVVKGAHHCWMITNPARGARKILEAL